jgi:hypothetical protein
MLSYIYLICILYAFYMLYFYMLFYMLHFFALFRTDFSTSVNPDSDIGLHREIFNFQLIYS